MYFPRDLPHALDIYKESVLSESCRGIRHVSHKLYYKECSRSLNIKENRIFLKAFPNAAY